MRGLIAALLTLLLCLLAACGGEIGADGPEPETVARAVLESQTEAGGLEALTGDDLDARLIQAYGLEAEDWTAAVVYTAQGMDAQEIAVILTTEGKTSAVADALKDYLKVRRGDFLGYAPAETALLERARVVTGDRYAALLVCPDMGAAETAFIGSLDADARLTVGLAPVPVETSADSDIGGFRPFDPPNQYDMTLYDTTAVLAAWERGDPSGLTEQDGAIYAKCREVFDQVIEEDMTDFEKELALHDWLVAWGTYDGTAYDDHRGRDGNTTPYGMLIGGYGICLGYATTFQLLMDLAEVECMTVVGASSDSASDHAWNMVRLGGEWYCVDPTWDDPSGDAPNWPQELKIEIQHRYFNVTSDYMRETDHQWDYQNVPEATATACRWDGTTALPTADQ